MVNGYWDSYRGFPSLRLSSPSQPPEQEQTMEKIVIPTTTEIFAMSRHRCHQERIRLKNEISFARGDEAIGGPPSQVKIAAFNRAVEAIDERLHDLTDLEAA